MIYSVYDNFIDSYTQLREHANACLFEDIENPADSVTYPGISKDIPNAIRAEIITKVSQVMGRMVRVNAMFLRLSTEGVSVPHVAHHDLLMGSHSLMLYLNDNDDAGTTFLKHIDTGMCYAPKLPEFQNIARNDQNALSAWARTAFIGMRQNRALFFDAGYFHCAEPVGGFGDSQCNGRVVLTCFFS